MDGPTVQEFIRLAPKMAHNIRDQLSIAQTAADFLMSDGSISPEVREKFSLLKAEVGHAAALAAQFITITRSEEKHLEVLDFQEIIAGLAPLLQRLLGDGIQFQMQIEPDLGPINVATDQFQDVFCILAVNARHAMPNGGTFRIRARNVKDTIGKNGSKDDASADCVSIEIEDTGVGIPELALGRIFEPFFTTKGAGCGFGLAKVYSVIKNANGRITAKSKVREGTTISILLPRHAPVDLS